MDHDRVGEGGNDGPPRRIAMSCESFPPEIRWTASEMPSRDSASKDCGGCSAGTRCPCWSAGCSRLSRTMPRPIFPLPTQQTRPSRATTSSPSRRRPVERPRVPRPGRRAQCSAHGPRRRARHHLNSLFAASVTDQYMNRSGEGIDPSSGALPDLVRKIRDSRLNVYAVAEALRPWRI
ncbi:hypothetical protein FBY22_3480 [Streptomyces sp. SLBN-31]|nr:hypothetical protein FBY22_3480 [Streptomyces sp. SLBN-31]